MPIGNCVSFRALTALVLCQLAFAQPATAQDRERTVERLLAEGWEVINLAAVQERRTVILFKHKDHKFLVQCSILVDVTRRPNVVTACYEIR